MFKRSFYKKVILFIGVFHRGKVTGVVMDNDLYAYELVHGD